MYIDGNQNQPEVKQLENKRSTTKKKSGFYINQQKEQGNIDEESKNNQQMFKIIQDDPYLTPYYLHFLHLNNIYKSVLTNIQNNEGSLSNFSQSYKQRGIYQQNDSIIYREWAPGIEEIYLFGEFNNWERFQFKGQKDQYGVWQIQIPHVNGHSAIAHNTKIKVYVKMKDGKYYDRIPVYIRYAIQNENTKVFDGVFWNPQQPYQFKYQRPQKKQNPKIYECHIGMAGIEPRVHTFLEFKNIVLPRIVILGYNIIQIMAIAEHAYYGSFGYHVTLPFAISSRLGTPEEFKELVDEAHKLGIQVLIDIVHSSNIDDGINYWDGTDHMYFHNGEKGKHSLWDSRLLNYQNYETLRLLLSNLAYFLQEYMVDGFRFDGITSMIYKHHGIGIGFTGNYSEYFNENIDDDALVYLMLANSLIHQLNNQAITVGEEVSGYPSLCRTLEDGGIGFDYRLAMAIPDKWIQILKEKADEQWDMGNLVFTLTNRRQNEPCIVYVESHDQALVGDKTIAMWLFDKEIYTNMSCQQQETFVINRGMNLHKIIRLLTLSLGGEGYLNFMGNEFGHPEWIDFPREGNGWSYQHCRRRWDLVDNQMLRYKFLNEWDKTIIHLEEKYNILSSKDENFISEKHEDNKVIVFEKAKLVFVFNFHSTKSFENYKIGTKWFSDHILILDSDDEKFGGHNRVKQAYNQNFPILKEEFNQRPYSINIYLPNRCVLVFKPIEYDLFQKIDK